MIRKAAGVLLVCALALGAAVCAQDFPPPALNPFLATKSRSGWSPPLPADAQLLGMNAVTALADLDDGAVYVETEYLRLASTLPAMRTPSRVYPRVRESLDGLAATYPKFKTKFPDLSPSQVAHLIAFHLERVMAETWRLFGTTRQTYVDYAKSHELGPYMRQKGKFEVFLFDSASDYQKFADRFTGRRSMLGQRYRTPATDALSFLVAPPPGGARSLNKWINLVVNNHAHNLLMSEVRNSWRVPTWLDLGFAHWMEQREGFETSTYTYGEAGRQYRFASGDWRPALRALLTAARAPEFDAFFDEPSLDAYDGDRCGVAFGLVDFMIREHLGGLRAFCARLRENDTLAVRDAFREAFGTSPSVFFERWQEWARTNYAPGGLGGLSRDPIPAK
ncbi:MAG: hypothetical protein JXQ29_17030 [Planctomycetes bacterium]|nr:hypothetical protein [Planctomycetota bacterium]